MEAECLERRFRPAVQKSIETGIVSAEAKRLEAFGKYPIDLDHRRIDRFGMIENLFDAAKRAAIRIFGRAKFRKEPLVHVRSIHTVEDFRQIESVSCLHNE